MCSIGGFLAPQGISSYYLTRFNELIVKMFQNSAERGRDSFGYFTNNQDGQTTSNRILFERGKFEKDRIQIKLNHKMICLIANNRAEPETEYKLNLTEKDIQPFCCENIAISHNGLVSNDKVLKTIYGETETNVDSAIIPRVVLGSENIIQAIEKLEGSFALAIYDLNTPTELTLYRDFNPLVLLYNQEQEIIVFTSFEKYFRENLTEQEQFQWQTIDIAPYSGKTLIGSPVHRSKLNISSFITKPRGQDKKALVVCSGGLDSVVVASSLIKQGYQITLLYFKYNHRAEARELAAIEALAKHWNVKYEVVDINFLGKLGGSSLTDSKIDLAEGEAGAEHAKDWVPARNTVLISIAAAYCDRFGFDTIALGLNLSEGASFMDNTTEFFEAFDHVLDLGTMKRPHIVCPLSNTMKHEIARIGMELDPIAIGLSYSCYTGEEKHCGKCASCYLRRKAFKMVDIVDPAEFSVNFREEKLEQILHYIDEHHGKAFKSLES